MSAEHDHNGGPFSGGPFSPWNWVNEALETLADANLLRDPVVRLSPQEPRALQIGDQSLVNFSSNDYLGLANDPRLGQAAAATIAVRGWGSGASPVVTGRGTAHDALESALAAFEGADDALLFPSGYAANLGVLTAIAGKGDFVFSDAKNHASIIDGCRLSGAAVSVYRHRDMEHLTQLLEGSLAAPKERSTVKEGGLRRVIVTDSLFSMDGCVAPLVELRELAEAFHAMLVVDEAHATGVFGKRGRGVCEWLGVEAPCLLRIGTMSKALGSAGGFVTGPAHVIRWLRNRARTQFFSTAMPEAMAAASSAALKIVDEEPQRRHELLRRAAGLRAALQAQGWAVPDGRSQIIPVVLGSPGQAIHCSDLLRERGFLAPPIRPPSVPAGESLLRVSVSYAHDPQILESFADAMGQLAPRPGGC